MLGINVYFSTFAKNEYCLERYFNQGLATGKSDQIERKSHEMNVFVP